MRDYVTIWLHMKPDPLGTVFRALAHSGRRRILDVVKARPGCNLNHVVEHFEISRIAVMKHVRVLEEAGLILGGKVGRARELYFNAVPIQLIYDRWTSEYSALWAQKLTKVKYSVESKGKSG